MLLLVAIYLALLQQVLFALRSLHSTPFSSLTLLKYFPFSSRFESEAPMGGLARASSAPYDPNEREHEKIGAAIHQQIHTGSQHGCTAVSQKDLSFSFRWCFRLWMFHLRTCVQVEKFAEKSPEVGMWQGTTVQVSLLCLQG